MAMQHLITNTEEITPFSLPLILRRFHRDLCKGN